MSLYRNLKEYNIDKFISYICDYEYRYFLNKKNVVGIGLGYKIKNGFNTFEKCIKVFVIKKISQKNLLTSDLIPRLYRGIKTDVIETGVFIASSFTKKVVPAIGGYVIGNESTDAIAGTFGCLLTDGMDLFILSNNHTIALSNNALIGTKILQPSLNYGGDLRNDVIANLTKYIQLKFKTRFRSPTNYVDCAIAKAVSNSLVSPNIALVGIPQGTKTAILNQDVRKVGFKTELTYGKVTTLSLTVQMLFPNQKTCLFKKQIATTKMNEGGDSGAVMLDNNNYVIGLLTGNTDTESVANPIASVLKNLNMSIITKSLWNYYKLNKNMQHRL